MFNYCFKLNFTVNSDSLTVCVYFSQCKRPSATPPLPHLLIVDETKRNATRKTPNATSTNERHRGVVVFVAAAVVDVVAVSRLLM